jgi:AcrR family transcriptional regulator
MADKPTAPDTGRGKPGRAPRADAQRNRALVLQVAAEVFATEGLSVPVHEIARRAGVGTGTVSRHFPTKEELFAAILLDRMKQLTEQADALADTRDAATAFFAFFATLVHEGAAHRGLAEALDRLGLDGIIDDASAETGREVHVMIFRTIEDAAGRKPTIKVWF